MSLSSDLAGESSCVGAPKTATGISTSSNAAVGSSSRLLSALQFGHTLSSIRGALSSFYGQPYSSIGMSLCGQQSFQSNSRDVQHEENGSVSSRRPVLEKMQAPMLLRLDSTGSEFELDRNADFCNQWWYTKDSFTGRRDTTAVMSSDFPFTSSSKAVCSDTAASAAAPKLVTQLRQSVIIGQPHKNSDTQFNTLSVNSHVASYHMRKFNSHHYRPTECYWRPTGYARTDGFTMSTGSENFHSMSAELTNKNICTSANGQYPMPYSVADDLF